MLPPKLVTSGPNAGSTFLNWDQTSEEQLSVRILTPENVVKYIIVDYGIFDAEAHLRDEDFDLDQFPEIPDGNWTCGHVIDSDGETILETSNTPLHSCSARDIWHEQSVDVLALHFEDSLSDAVNRCKDPSTGLDAVAKFARQPQDIQSIQKEGNVYEKLQATSFGPRFLAHLTENGRTIGFLLEFIHGRRPVSTDFSICKAALDALHAIGLCHGDLHTGNFIVREHDVVLIDFERCSEIEGDAEKEAEIAELSTLRESLI